MANEDATGEEARPALISALTTEHFVLQTAYSSTISEAGVRSTLYVMALSSSLVAMGFFAQAREAFVPFAASVLPVVVVLGVFTVVRLVDTGLESMGYLTGIAAIRARYRGLGADAARLFAPERGRWPEAKAPSLALGVVAGHLGTTAAMITVVNSVVGGAWVLLLVGDVAGGLARGWRIAIVVAVTLVLAAAFFAYQRWRFAAFDGASPVNDGAERTTP